MIWASVDLDSLSLSSSNMRESPFSGGTPRGSLRASIRGAQLSRTFGPNSWHDLGFTQSRVRERPVISIGDIYDKDVNFLFGSGASTGLLPTLQLKMRTGEGDGRYSLEELATKFEQEDQDRRRLVPLFMHYYWSCIRPAEKLTLQSSTSTVEGATAIKNYQTFLATALEMVKRRKALDRRCNVFTTNYDGCFPLVADALIKQGHTDFVLNDGTRGFTRRILQARNFGSESPRIS